MNENKKRIEIGSLWTVRAPWYDQGLGRLTTIGEIVEVLGIDRSGDPIFVSPAPADLEGSVYASDFLDRTDFYGPATASPAPDPDRKPRGVKPPMALIPWSVVPEAWVPEAVDLALGLPERTAPESFAARVIRILLETSADDLLPEVARVMGHGAAKYGVDNWRTATWGPDARREYESAMLRHLYADAIGEAFDPDSGRLHKAHAVASAMILEWHDRRVAGALAGSE